MMRKQKGILILAIAIFVTLFYIGSVGISIYRSWQVSKDTDQWLERAQVASNIADMEYYLKKARDGMDKWDTTTGYSAFIFRGPENDMELITRALDQNIERCHKYRNFDPMSNAYITALDDLRGSIRELELDAVDAFWVHKGFLPVLIWGIWLALGWIAVIIAWYWFLETWF